MESGSECATYISHIFGISWGYLRHLLGIYCAYLGHILGIFLSYLKQTEAKCFGHIFGISRAYLEHIFIPWHPWAYLEYILDMSLEYFGHILAEIHLLKHKYDSPQKRE